MGQPLHRQHRRTRFTEWPLLRLVGPGPPELEARLEALRDQTRTATMRTWRLQTISAVRRSEAAALCAGLDWQAQYLRQSGDKLIEELDG